MSLGPYTVSHGELGTLQTRAQYMGVVIVVDASLIKKKPASRSFWSKEEIQGKRS
jgi:hypothetical protein